MTESTGNDKWQKLNSSVSYWPSALSSAQPGKTDHHDPSYVIVHLLHHTIEDAHFLPGWLSSLVGVSDRSSMNLYVS
jgi:hypothetical protein